MSSVVSENKTYTTVCAIVEKCSTCEFVVQYVEGVQGSACGKSYNSCSSAGIACFPHSMTVQCTVVLCFAKDIYM